jgi:hypothetical protein
MTVFYLGAAIGLILAVVYLVVSALSFLRIRRELLNGSWELDDSERQQADPGSNPVALVPGFTWKAGLAAVASLVALVIASYSGAFWYVLAFSGLGTAAAVIVAFAIELRTEHQAAQLAQ